MAWRERVGVEKSRKLQSLHSGIRLGYVSQVDIFDLKDKGITKLLERHRNHSESQKLIPIDKQMLLKDINNRPNAGLE